MSGRLMSGFILNTFIVFLAIGVAAIIFGFGYTLYNDRNRAYWDCDGVLDAGQVFANSAIYKSWAVCDNGTMIVYERACVLGDNTTCFKYEMVKR